MGKASAAKIEPKVRSRKMSRKIVTTESRVKADDIGMRWIEENTMSNITYYSGAYLTPDGWIELQWKPDGGWPRTKARIIHKGYCYTLRTKDKVTQLGWIRIAKRWAKKIWGTK